LVLHFVIIEWMDHLDPYDGFLLPRSLLVPEEWPTREKTDLRPWLLSIELIMKTGGPLSQHLERIALSGPVIWWIDAYPTDPDAFNAILSLQKQTVIWARVSIASRIQSSCLGMSVIAKSPLPATTPLAWLHAILPRSIAHFGELKFHSLLRRYLAEVASDKNGWAFEVLSYFPSFVRQMGDAELTSSVAREWIRTSVFLSPQTVKPHNRTDVLKLNPTLEYLRVGNGSEARLLIFFRTSSGQLIEQSLKWQEALILDEFLEQPEHDLTQLLTHLQTHDVRTHLDSLIEQGALL
jgi:hypothetical protein